LISRIFLVFGIYWRVKGVTKACIKSYTCWGAV